MTPPLIPALIREARLARGMSQDELALRCGCTQRDVALWERGRKEVYQPRRLLLADALGVSIEALAGLEPFVIRVEPPAPKRTHQAPAWLVAEREASIERAKRKGWLRGRCPEMRVLPDSRRG